MATKRKAATSPTNDSKKPKKDSTLTSFFGQPKVVPAGGKSTSAPESEGAATNFDKDKWVATLSDEQKDLLKLEIDTLDPTWLSHLKDEVTKPSFLDLKRFLKREIDAGKTIFPPMEDVYSWSRHCPLNTVKVVIVGQDPYHNHNQAHGLCFSVRPPTKAPPSLKNMYQELKTDYPSFKPPPNNLGLLTPWADQGILLINTCLTVQAHEAASHKDKGWEPFTQKIIDTVVKVRNHGVVFIAWGTPAQKRCAKITGAKHLVLKGVHPSPLSAHKGFFGCGHFRKTNDWLEERYGKDGVINWNLDVQKPIKAPEVKDDSVKVTAGQDKPEKAQAATKESPATKKDKPAESKGESDYEDDEDAIEAMEELARSDAIEPPEKEVEKSEEKEDEKDDEKENVATPKADTKRTTRGSGKKSK